MKTIQPFYSKRVWLNPNHKDSTSSIVCFNGMVKDFEGKLYPSTFVEIADCHHKIHLHQTSDDTREEFITKLQLLRDELNLFIDDLNNRS